MKLPPDGNWTPDPQQLAAYFDGELDDSPDFVVLRQRLEAWLKQHPEAVEEQKTYRRLNKIWRDTTPAEPSAEAWNNTLQRIEEEARKRANQPVARRPWLGIAAGALGFVMFFGLLLGLLRYSPWSPTPGPSLVEKGGPKEKTPPDEPIEVFAVATADEVIILRVEGEDTDALVVGRLPLEGSMVLAAQGDVRFVSPKTDERLQMLPRPMIWAMLETDDE
jgi:hypothetical protein